MSNSTEHPLVGTWRSLEDMLSDVQYTVAFKDGMFSVAAVDSYDGEIGQVHGVEWNESNSTLNFCCYWESSGRFSKCRLSLISDGKANFTYQYTDHEILVKKGSQIEC